MRTLRFILLLACSAPAILSAQSLVWDPNGDVPDAGTGGGPWDTSTVNWRDSTVGMTIWLNNGTIRPTIFTHVGDFTLSVNSSILTRGLAINTTAYLGSTITFSGAGSLTLTDPSVDVQNGNAAFNVSLISTVGLTLSSNYSGREMRLNIANPGLQGLIAVDSGTLLYNHAGAIGPESGGTPNSIEIGDGTLRFGAVGGGNFAYTLADPILIWGSNSYTPRISIVEDGVSTRSATLTGPITLEEDARFKGGDPYAAGRAQIISSGVISGVNENVRIEGDVVLSGANTFTGQVMVAFENAYSGNSRVTVPVFNNDFTAGPLGAGAGLVLGRDAGEGGPSGEVFYTGGTATSNRTIQINGDSGTVGVTNPASTLTLTGVISGSGGSVSHDFEKAGPGALVLKGNNTFQGDTQLTNGTLIVGHNNALGTNSEAEVEVGTAHTGAVDILSLLLENGVTLAKEVTVNNNNYDGQTALGMAGSGASTFANDVYVERSIFVKADANAVVNFAGFVSDGTGGGSITKTGVGTAVFNNVDLRIGGFIANQGTLQLNGPIYSNGGIVVQNGATLSGNANITYGAVTIQSGGILSPGNGLGALTMPSLSMTSGSQLLWQLGALTTTNIAQFDRVLVNTASESDSMTISSAATLTLDLSLLSSGDRPTQVFALNNAFWQSTETWLLVDFSGPGSNSFGLGGQVNPFSLTNGTFAGGFFTTFVGNGSGGFSVGDVFLQFTPVPEPSTWALLVTGGAMAFFARRRRR